MKARTTPTAEQVAVEIEALKAIKPKVRKRNHFGEDNHAAIDAQIAVLGGLMTMTEVYDAYGDNADLDDHVLNAATDAATWLIGEMPEESPSQSWATAAPL